MMMMDMTLLQLFYLSGWFIFFSGSYHDYHFVNTPMNWSQAQTYCRTTYTDLATIETITEINQVINVSSSSSSQVWIGVNAGLFWFWTYKDILVDWQNETQNDPVIPCCFGLSYSTNGIPQLDDCFVEHPFVCLNGSNEVYVNQSMNWLRAWSYCRENFTDLDSQRYSSYTNTSWLYNQNMNNFLPPNVRVWIGAVYFPIMFWSDGSSYSFSYWDNITYTFNSLVPWAYGAVDLQRSGKWRLLPQQTTLPFICYGSLNVSTTTQAPTSNTTTTQAPTTSNNSATTQAPTTNTTTTQAPTTNSTTTQAPTTSNNSTTTQAPTVDKKSITVFKLRLSSSVDLNNPDVNENILKQLQDRLEEKGLSGVTLSWRKQPDGKIFHKEEERKEANDGC